MRKRRSARKVVDETIKLGRPRRGAILRYEVWETQDGQVARYNLAYINPAECSADNGRVLGYDNAHGQHHRHFRGALEPVRLATYQQVSARFLKEVWELWRKEDEERKK